MRTLNIRLAVVLLVAMLLLCVGAYLLHGFQVERNAYVLLEQADRAEESAEAAAEEENDEQRQKSMAEAVKCLSWYVRLMPNDVEARERLGLLLADWSTFAPPADRLFWFRQARGQLEATVALDAGRDKARGKLVDLSIMSRRYQDAKDHLQMTLLQKRPEDPELLEKLGICQMRMGDFVDARKSFEKAIECGPDRVDSYWQLAVLFRSQLSLPDEAARVMDELVEANPESAKAHFYRGRYLASAGAREESLPELTKALELAPDDFPSLLLFARVNLAEGNLDEARRAAARGIELRPEVADLYAMLADVEMRDRDRDKAVAVLERGLRETNQNPPLLYKLAHLLIDMKKFDQARKYIKDLSATDYSHSRIGLLKARIDFAQERWLAAKEGFERVRSSADLAGMGPQIDVWIAHCYGRLGNPGMKEKALRRAISADPDFIPAIEELTRLNMATGQVDEAIAGVRQLASSGHIVPGGALAYAQMLIFKTLQLPPDRRNWQAATEALDRAAQAMPDSPNVIVLRAQLLFAQGREAEAEHMLLDARDNDPKQAAYWDMLISMAYPVKDWDRAEQLLRESVEAIGDVPQRRVVWARYYTTRFGSEAAEHLRKLADNVDEFTDEQKLALWSGLINIAARIKDSQLVDALGERIVALRPDDVNVRYFVFEQALKDQDRSAIEKSLEEIERVAGHGHYWSFGQAVLLFLDARDEEDAAKRNALLEEALKHLARAGELREDWSRVPLLEAGIHDALRQPDAALEKYREAFSLGAHTPEAVLRIVQHLLAVRQYTEADHVLRQIEEETDKLTPELYRVSAEVALRQEDYDRALEMTNKADVSESENYLEHLWKGQMLSSLGGRAKAADQSNADELLADAEKSLRRAAELEPRQPQVWLALVKFLTASGKTDQAEQVLAEVRQQLPEKAAPLALAQCYEAMQRPDAAARQYEAAALADPDNSVVAKVVAAFYVRTDRLAEAETHLQKIIEGDLKIEPADIAWARRQLALAYAKRGGYMNFRKAKQLIEKNLASPEASDADRRLLARLCAADPARTQREQAIRIFEDIGDDQAATPGDQLALAKMYEADGDWIKAGGVYRDLVAGYPKEPRFLIAYIKGLIRNNEFSSCEMYLERLRSIAPDEPSTLALRAALLCARKQPDEAMNLLLRHADDPKAKDRTTRLRFAADQLNRLARWLDAEGQKEAAEQFLNQAEAYYREYAWNAPARYLSLAVFLGSRGKLAEATDLLEKGAVANSPEAFAQACAFLAKFAAKDKSQIRRLDAIIEWGLGRFRRHSSVLLVLADFRASQGRYEDAEALYREEIRKHPDNAVAMNNLAVMLALRGVKLDEALELMQKAISLAGPLGSMLDSRASVYIALGEADKALADIDNAVANAATPVRLFHKAQALRLTGKTAEANETFQQALDEGLTVEMLQPLEAPAFEDFQKSMQ